MVLANQLLFMISLLRSNSRWLFYVIFKHRLRLYILSFKKSLWQCVNTTSPCDSQSSNPLYRYNIDYDLCFFFDPSITVKWIQSYEYCLNISGTLAMLDTDEKYQFARNLTQISGFDSVWVFDIWYDFQLNYKYRA